MRNMYRSIWALVAVVLLIATMVPIASAASSCTPSGTNVTSTTCTQNTAITSAAPNGGPVVSGSPYPSIITVPANTVSGTVTKVVLKLNGINHTGAIGDLGLLLVSPSGKALSPFSFVGNFAAQSGINLTMDDAAASFMPCDGAMALVSGTFKPSVCGTNANWTGFFVGFPAGTGWTGCTSACPHAAPVGSATLASIFNSETAPNGDWKLFTRDMGALGGTGTITSWQLIITTSGVASAATSTAISSAPTPVLRTTPGASDTTTITASVTSASAVNGGTVSFTDNGSALACVGGNPTVSAGAATCNATFASEGVHNIQASYTGTAGLAPSNTTGNAFVMVNNRSTLSAVTSTGGQFCNNGSIALPGAGTPRVFPSNMYVTGNGSPTGGNAFGGVITGLTISLNSFSHTFGTLASMLLVSPSGKPYMMMANAFQGTNFGPVNLVLSDAGGAFIPSGSAATSGTFKPADYNPSTSQDPAAYANRNLAALFNPLPAPTTGYFFSAGNGLGTATFATTFGGGSPNGNWRLYAINSVDGGNTGSVGSWCLNFTVSPSPVLAVTKSHTGNFTQGQSGVWNINVSNTAPAAGVTSGTTTVTDTLPAGYTLTSFSGAGWSCTGIGTANVSCTNSSAVAGGASFAALALTVNLAANSPASVTNTAIVNGGGTVSGPVSSSADTVIVIRTQTITFPAITPFSWYQGSATLAATASSGLTVAYAVSSGPCSLAGNVLTASSPGTCLVTASQSGNASFLPAAQQSQSITINVGPALLDIDASGAPTKYDAATDGMMVIRFLLGYQGNTVTNDAFSATPGRTPTQAIAHLTSIAPLLDVDGDGVTRAASDGLLILRYMLGLRGAALTAGAAAGAATAPQVETAIGRLTPP